VTSAWYVTPRPGFDAGDKDAFELLEYSIDGVQSSIRRNAHKAGQTYTAKIPEDVMVAGKPVRVSYLYRTITPQSGHLLYFDIEQPTRNISLDLDYSDSSIHNVSVLDLIASGRRTRITRSPEDLPGRTTRVAFDGWMFPRTGLAFVWTLESELKTSAKPTVT